MTESAPPSTPTETIEDFSLKPVRSSTETLAESLIADMNGDFDTHIEEGMKMIQALLEKYPSASDIQIRCDKHVRVQLAKGVVIVEEFGRLDPMKAAGAILALYRCRSGARVGISSSMTEDMAFLRRLGKVKVADFACRGDSLMEETIDRGRMRVHAFWETHGLSATARLLYDKIPDLKTLSFRPDTIDMMLKMTARTSGIAFVTGQTGNGKSTTLASLLSEIMRMRDTHIVTVEDPIEFQFSDIVAGHTLNTLITQQEVGTDVESFHQGVVTVLRKHPEIVLVGEIRERKTMEAALEAAETGHLVLSTLHTRNAPATIARIINMFREDERESILNTLADTLLFVLSQGLMRSARDPKRRVLCYEFMVNTCSTSRSAIASYSRSPASLSSWVGRKENVQWDRYLRDLHESGEISKEDFLARVQDEALAGVSNPAEDSGR